MKRILLLLVVALALFAIGIRWIVMYIERPAQMITGAGGPMNSVAPSPADQHKLTILEDVLRSRNDNDPRLDQEFNDLTPEAKRLFRNEYREIAVEKRNQRGTIVYLLGKNLRTADDWKFFREVALEPPCLSMSNCSKKPAPGSDEEATGDEVTLAYPSLVALRQARRAVEEAHARRASAQDASALATEKAALDLFAAAKNSKVRAVGRTAASLEKKFALP
jgi:hypothetical protein